MSHYDAHCISEIQKSGLILLIEESIQRNFKSESTLSALLNLLAVLISNRFSFVGVSSRIHGETPAGNGALRVARENRGDRAAGHVDLAAHGDFVESLALWYAKNSPDFCNSKNRAENRS